MIHKRSTPLTHAWAHKGQPTVFLAKTIKGYGLGPAFAGRNTISPEEEEGRHGNHAGHAHRSRPFVYEQAIKAEYYKPAEDSPEIKHRHERRSSADSLPQRTPKIAIDRLPDESIYAAAYAGTTAALSTTMQVYANNILPAMLKDPNIGKLLVPIIPDEARTFGMDPLFAEFGIYHPEGQLYKPVDHNVLMKYKESAKGQLFEEGINEAGATSTFIASATSYSTHLYPTVPFYTFYSMFGFQRVADLIWSAADQRARGFLMGATSGRTTLNGEGLQHQDGHSLLMAHTNPAVRAWDPAFAYELATIIRHGIEEMYVDNQDVLHYIAIYNENYPMPPKPKGADEGIIKGMYLLRGAPKGDGPLVRLIGSGPIMVQVLDAVEKLETYGVRCEIYSATSYGELRREGLAWTDTTASIRPTRLRSPTWRPCSLNRCPPSPSPTTWRPSRT